MSLDGGGCTTSAIQAKKRMIKPMRLDPPEEMGKSKVHAGMTIGESIMQSVVYDVIERKAQEDREKWMSPTDGLHGTGKSQL